MPNLDNILAPDPSTALLRQKYAIAFAALNAINCDAITLTDAQFRARLAVQTCIDLGDSSEMRATIPNEENEENPRDDYT